MQQQATARQGLTRRMVARCMQGQHEARHEALPPEVRAVAAQCVLDWLGVSLAALDEAGPRILRDELAARGGVAEATLLGSALRLPAASAAEYNGTLGHELDYDDVNMAITGHATAVMMPALMALAQQRGIASGARLLAALVAGTEMACRVGRLVAPSHYARGFHSTATAGSLGAAVACAHLDGLSVDQACIAVGLAATQASGLKAMFGSMGKPWHAGLAARNGLMAARLAARGFQGPQDVLEHAQGFASAYSGDFNVDAAMQEPEGGWHIRNTLFKYHASCYGTNGCMEALIALMREHGFVAADVDRVEILAHSGSATICNIQDPASGTEAKFSLRACAAMTLAGIDTSVPAVFGDASLAHPQVRRLVPRIAVGFTPDIAPMAAGVRVVLHDGTTHRGFHDAGVATGDVGAQQARVERKFAALVGGLVGGAAGQDVVRGIVQAVNTLEAASLGDVTQALRGCER